MDFFPEVAHRYSANWTLDAKINLLFTLTSPDEVLNRLSSWDSEGVARELQDLEAESQPAPIPGPSSVVQPLGPRPRPETPLVWCSFAEEDARYFEDLHRHLAVFENAGGFSLVGAPIGNASANQKMVAASLIVVLVSPAYLAAGQERIDAVLRAHDGGRGIPVLMVMLRPALFSQTPLASLGTPLLSDQPLVGTTGARRDQAWVSVAGAIWTTLQFPSRSNREEPPPTLVRTRSIPEPLDAEDSTASPVPALQSVVPPTTGTAAAGPPPATAEVFSFNGVPSVVRVETKQSRDLYKRLRMPVAPGLLIVEGPSGIGKTTAVRIALDQLKMLKLTRFLDPTNIQELDALVETEMAGWSYLVVDEFHLLEPRRQFQVAELVKRLGDHSRHNAKVVAIGINPLGETLGQRLADILGSRITSVPMHGRQPNETIDALISEGERALNVEFLDRSGYILESQGSMQLAQRLCFEAAFEAELHERPVLQTPIAMPAAQAVRRILDNLAHRFRPLLLKFATLDEEPPPRGACLYALFHLARSDTESVMLREIAGLYLGDPAVRAGFDWILSSNLRGKFQAHPDLGKLLYYDPETTALSAEDPQLWCYLRRIDWQEFARRSGHEVIRLNEEGLPILRGRGSTGGIGVGALASAPELEPAAPPPPSPQLYVHLSDLHFGADSQATIWSSQLVQDLKQNLALTRIDGLILSGDIANLAKRQEYDAAEKFIARVMKEFSVEPHQLILVPGNHDVDWSVTKKAYQAQRREQTDGFRPGIDYAESITSAYVELRNDKKYQARSKTFADFYQRVTRQPYPIEPSEQGLVCFFESSGVLFLGLNSAWQVDHNYPTRSSISDVALSRAIDQVLTTPLYREARLKIAVFHHPVGGADAARLRDTGFLERLALSGFRLALHGHVHEPGDWSFRYYRERGLDILGAGTFGAEAPHRPPSVPRHYQILEVDAQRIRVRSRRLDKATGAWDADFCYRLAPGLPKQDYIDLPLRGP